MIMTPHFSLNVINRFSNSISMLRLDQVDPVASRKNLEKFVILLMATVFITQTPFYVVSLFTQSKVACLMMLLSSALNPLLYSYRMKKVRTSLISLFKRSDTQLIPPV